MGTLIAMDVHKRTSTIAAFDPSTGEIKIMRCHTEPNDIARKLAKLPRPWTVAVESSRHSPPVCRWLQRYGAVVKLVHPQKLAALLQLEAAKTDAQDAETMLDLMRLDRLPECYLAPEEVTELRALTRGRNVLRELSTKGRNVVHSLLAQCGFVVEQKDLRGKAAREKLPELIEQMGDLSGLMTALFLTLIDDIERLIEVVESEMDDQVRQHRVARELVKRDGIGNVLALSLVAELGEIERFASHKHLHSYAGVVPRISESGDRRREGRLSAYCNRHLRRVAVQCAQCMMMCRADSRVKGTYKRLRGRKGANTAKIAAARKVLTEVFFIWHEVASETA